MTIEVRDITDENEWLEWRRHDVTAHGAGALLGIHPYQTPYQLWVEKTGKVPPNPDTEVYSQERDDLGRFTAKLIKQNTAIKRGKILEPIAIDMLASERPNWSVQAPHQYYRDRDARLGATPDVIAYDPDRPGFGTVQVKSVASWVFSHRWKNEEGEVEPPLWIAVQALVERELTGATWCAIAALVVDFGIDLHIVDVPLVPELIQRVRYEVADFWRIVDEGRRPPLDWKRDGKLYEALYTPTALAVDLGSDNEIPGLLIEREACSKEINKATERKAEIKTILLSKLGGASLGHLADGRVLTAGRRNNPGYTVDPYSFVELRVRKGRSK